MKRNAHDDADSKTRTSRRFTRPLMLALLASSIASVAHAQSTPPPPTQSSVDENGVDVITGAIYLSSPGISVGQPGAGGLVYQRTYDSDIQGWRDNVTGGINVDTAGTTFTVTLLGVSEEFTLAGGVFTSSEGRGGTLTLSGNTYTYTTASGVVALYDKGLAGTQPTQANEGRVTQMTLPSGERLTFTYVTLTGEGFLAQRLQSVTNNLGYQLAFEYQSNAADATGLQLKRVVALNNAVEYCAPTANGCTLTGNWMRLDFGYGSGFETVTDVLGRTMRYAISSGRITGVRWPSSTSDNITISYNSGDGSVVSVSNGTGTWNYVYQITGSQQVTSVSDPGSDTEVYEANLSTGRVTRFQSGEGNVTQYNYDSNGRLTSIIESLTNYRTFAYDSRGNVTQVREFANSLGGVPDGAITVFSATYAASCTNPVTCNLPISTTDALGNTTDYTYDSTHGGLLTVTAPDPDGAGALVRPQSRYTYAQLSAAYIQSPGGSPTTAPSAVYRLTNVSACATTSSCANGADETKTTVAYATNNLLPTSVTSGAGNGALTATAASTYDAIGNLLTIDGPLSGNADTTRYRYDAGRQSLGVVGPDPDGGAALLHRALRFTYNVDGQVTAVERGTVNSQSDSDWAAFASLETQAYVYDTLGRRVRESFAAGGATHALVQYSYDAENKLECIAVRMNPAVFAAPPSSACTLGTAGANGPDRIARTIYDNADRVIQVQSAYGTPLQQTTLTQTYTANGQVATVTDARNNVTAYEYDGIDRLIKVRMPLAASGGGSASTSDYEAFTYNNAGAVTQRRLRDGGLVNFSYDALMRVTLVDAPAGTNDVSYAYDNFSRLTQSASGGQTLSFSYDQLSRLTSAGGPLGAVAYQYDLAGRQTRITWPDAFYAAYEYDVVGALTAVRENGAASGAGVLALYVYDNFGRRASLTRGNGVVTTYAYDSASRLDVLSHNLPGTGSDVTLDFAHNAAGQILSRDRSSANGSYVYPQPGMNVDAYASNGLNQIASLDGAGLTYDARGNLTSAGGVSYTYDAFNRLLSAGGVSLSYDPAGRLYETSASGSTTRFLYDGLHAIAEYNTSGTLLRRYIPGVGLDEHLVWYAGAGTSDRRWIVQDDLGSVIAVSDGTGAALNINSYDEYGAAAAANTGLFGYTGQMWLPAAGLYHFRARAYSPALGRFLQTDPIGMAGGMNLYAYVGADPLNRIDPLGLQSRDDDDIVVPWDPCWNTALRCYGGDSVGDVVRGANVGEYMPVRLLRETREPRIRDLPLEEGELVVEAPRRTSPPPPPSPPSLSDVLRILGLIAGRAGPQGAVAWAWWPGDAIAPTCEQYPEECAAAAAGPLNGMTPMSEPERVCREQCTWILERPYRWPGDDRNTWDYHRCVADCLRNWPGG